MYKKKNMTLILETPYSFAPSSFRFDSIRLDSRKTNNIENIDKFSTFLCYKFEEFCWGRKKLLLEGKKNFFFLELFFHALATEWESVDTTLLWFLPVAISFSSLLSNQMRCEATAKKIKRIRFCSAEALYDDDDVKEREKLSLKNWE